MSEAQTYMSPGTLGFLIVAIVSLPLTLAQFLEKGGPTAQFFEVAGVILFLIGVWAWKCSDNFAFTVFGVAGAAIFLTGFGMGYWENIAFAVFFAFSVVWAIIINGPKNLVLLLITTTLVFLFVGLSAEEVIGGDYWRWLIGAAGLGNFIFTFYMGMSCAAPQVFKSF